MKWDQSVLLPRACEVCQSKEKLKRCTGCQVVYYCSRAHQRSDRAKHRESCCSVESTRATADLEEAALRIEIGDRLWEEWTGEFDRYEETFPYLISRHAFAQMLFMHFGGVGGHRESLSLAVSHMEDILRLGPGDYSGVRFDLSFLYLRLGRDQEAYDFVKWWITTGDIPGYNWEDPRSSMLEAKNAVVLEDPPRRTLCRACGGPDLRFVLLLAIVKARLVVNLIALQNATRVLRGRMPQEHIDMVRGHALGSSYACRGVLLKCTPRQISAFIRKAKGHLQDLCYALEERNTYYLEMIFQGGPLVLFEPLPPEKTRGSLEEAQIGLVGGYPAWAESPGTIRLIRSLMRPREGRSSE
ncbi:uncharacterized protein E0L32_004288 [Thyridium curvatum]|uniref:MYND-type domain-containing protein n=1 Tax=Thyridium curvatum TaxID=1093900 RepID=A0A507BGB3_9PEZI|nr:uncharacterized protein E0L32_004288 [Thyridium curvatum]TPX15590.1 hypothetical protein E0L32_004288 [Thyridium curvatum]